MKSFISLLEWFLNNKRIIFIWLITGFLVFFFTTFLLYIFVDHLFIKLSVATLLSAELAIILRFYINHKIIFNSNKPILSSFFNFHLAGGLGLIVWWISTNGLAFIGIYYIYASLIALVLTTAVNFITNFFWIWRKK
tara:strand:- start:3244 stop:3654 length:411 start_codon:yes stop_codon:yes gene_type:complete